MTEVETGAPRRRPIREARSALLLARGILSVAAAVLWALFAATFALRRKWWFAAVGLIREPGKGRRR